MCEPRITGTKAARPFADHGSHRHGTVCPAHGVGMGGGWGDRLIGPLPDPVPWRWGWEPANLAELGYCV